MRFFYALATATLMFDEILFNDAQNESLTLAKLATTDGLRLTVNLIKKRAGKPLKNRLNFLGNVSVGGVRWGVSVGNVTIQNVSKFLKSFVYVECKSCDDI